MLYLTTADLNGKKYDKSIVSAKEVIKLLGINEAFESEVIYFRVPASGVKPNKDNAGVFDFQRCLISNEVHGIFQGQGFTLQYTQFPVRPNDNGNLIIKKEIIHQMTDPEWYMSTDSENLEKTLLVYLWKGNQNSPVRTKTNDVYYETYDPEADAKLANQMLKMEMDFFADLQVKMSTSPKAVRILAKGLDSIMSIQNLDSISDSELQLALAKRARQNLTSFKKAWEDSATYEKGLLQDAIDKKIIAFENVNGQTCWVWSDTKEVLVQVSNGIDARLKLKEYMDRNVGTLLAMFEDKLQGKTEGATSKAKK